MVTIQEYIPGPESDEMLGTYRIMILGIPVAVIRKGR